MKIPSCLAYLFLILIVPAYAQIQTTAFPAAGFESRIRDTVNDIWIIDTHEHLQTEEMRLEQKNLDFTYLFNQYAIEECHFFRPFQPTGTLGTF